MGQILLVEDQASLNEINRRALTLSGHDVHAAYSLGQARAWLMSHEPDVILLDILLPDGNGFDFCAEIRDRTRAHILFLTSRIEHLDRVRGLTLGGDDYITKPYKMDELIARVDAAMRRRMIDARHASARRTFGSLALDVVAGRAYVRGQDLLLSQKEFSLLCVLAERIGLPVDKAALYRRVWDQPAQDDNALKVVVSRLRGKLSAVDCEWTVSAARGEGYSLAERTLQI